MIRSGLRVREVAALLGTNERAIYRALERGELHAETVSGVKIIPAAEVIAKFGEPIDVDLGESA